MDLASLNIQRGRDHGLGDINEIRVDLGLSAYTSFLDLTGGDVDLANDFASVYSSIDDVDFVIGGLAESSFNGGLLGETFNTIVSDQFIRSRDGDRFFYLNDLDHLVAFDSNIESTSLSDIIRRNSTISSVQDDVFIVESEAVPEPLSILGTITAGLMGVIFV